VPRAAAQAWCARMAPTMPMPAPKRLLHVAELPLQPGRVLADPPPSPGAAWRPIMREIEQRTQAALRATVHADET
jgi:hypothetical protein